MQERMEVHPLLPNASTSQIKYPACVENKLKSFKELNYIIPESVYHQLLQIANFHHVSKRSMLTVY